MWFSSASLSHSRYLNLFQFYCVFIESLKKYIKHEKGPSSLSKWGNLTSKTAVAKSPFSLSLGHYKSTQLDVELSENGKDNSTMMSVSELDGSITINN